METLYSIKALKRAVSHNRNRWEAVRDEVSDQDEVLVWTALKRFFCVRRLRRRLNGRQGHKEFELWGFRIFKASCG